MISAFGVVHKGLLRGKKPVFIYRQAQDRVDDSKNLMLVREKNQWWRNVEGSGMDEPTITRNWRGKTKFKGNENQELHQKYLSNVARRNGYTRWKPTTEEPNRLVREQSVKQKVRSAFSRYETGEVPPSPTLKGLVKPGNRQGATVVTYKKPLERVPGTYIVGAAGVGAPGVYLASRKKSSG